MAEFTNVFVQQIAANGNAVFSETPVSGSNCIVHRDGSGIITLRGMTNQCRARYKVVFGGNIAIPTGGSHLRRYRRGGRGTWKCDSCCDACGSRGLFQCICRRIY